MAATSQVCYEVEFHPGGAEIWLMQPRITCSSTWQGGGDTVDSGFLYDFSIRLMLATSIRFCVTISQCLSSSYSPSTAKSFSSHVCLFLFHCTWSSLLNCFSSKVLLFVEPLPLLIGPRGIVLDACCVYQLFVAAVGVFSLLTFFPLVVWLPSPPPLPPLLLPPPLFFGAAVSFIALSDGESDNSVAEGGKRL